tara:strand:- start:1919 stop:2860 length:942 start_codon:yes stop_codon:yes gene_type:complete
MLRFFLLIPLVMLTVSSCDRPAERAVLVGNAWLGAAPIFSAAATHPAVLPRQLKPVMLVSDISVLRMLSNDAAVGAFVSLDNALGMNTMTQGGYCVAMVIDRSLGADAIIAHEDWRDDPEKPIHVGLEDSTLARYVLSQWMKVNGIAPERVSTQVLVPSEHLSVWTERETDLVVTYQPFVERLKQRGGQVIFDSRHTELKITDVLIINKQRWPALAPAVMALRDQSWPHIMSLLEQRQIEFWQALQALTDLGEAELTTGLADVEFVSAAEQEKALAKLLQEDIPQVAEHLIQSNVYDQVTPLSRCDQLSEVVE